MAQNSRKRPLDLDQSERKTKMLRSNPRKLREDPTTPILPTSFGSASPTQHDNTSNALATYLNKARQSLPDTKSEESVTDLHRQSFSRNTSAPVLPLKYRPLETYKKAEALRLVFMRKGLQYMQAGSNTGTTSEEALAPYIEEWEDCLKHWHLILGPNAFDGDKEKDNDAKLPSSAGKWYQIHNDSGSEQLKLSPFVASPIHLATDLPIASDLSFWASPSLNAT